MKSITGLILGLASVPGSLKLSANNFDAGPGVIVLSDIEADPDDNQSFVDIGVWGGGGRKYPGSDVAQDQTYQIKEGGRETDFQTQGLYNFIPG